jgi:hypothetical protein
LPFIGDSAVSCVVSVFRRVVESRVRQLVAMPTTWVRPPAATVGWRSSSSGDGWALAGNCRASAARIPAGSPFGGDG